MNKHRKQAHQAKRLLSFVLAAALVFPIFAETGLTQVRAGENTIEQPEKQYGQNGYKITYAVKSEWEAHQTVEITVENTGEETIRDWAVLIEGTGTVTGLWNAAVLSENEAQTTVKSCNYNNVVGAGQEVTFGYTLEGENLSFPENVSLCAPTQKKQENGQVEFVVTGDWEDGFQGEIRIYNPSETVISGWSLDFTGNFQIQDLWNGELVSAENGNYTVSHTAWQNEIPADSVYIIGFVGTKTDPEMEIESYTLYAIEEFDGKTETKPGEENTQDEINWEDATDTDGDGLPDVYEKYMFESDAENADSDGDGLPDGYEVLELGTSPVLADSNNDGVLDSDSDEDNDGLTNLEEYVLGTDPLSEDTDYDGLEDKDELEVYGTDPLKADTDGDGIDDGDEIRLGLDPLNPATHGVADSLYCIEQEVTADSSVLKKVNETAENPYEISLVVNASGAAEDNLYLDGSSYGTVFDSEAAVGSPLFIEYNDDMSLETVRITYHMDESVVDNELDLFGEDTTELHGIRRFNVFWFDEEINMLLPIETFHDEEKGLVYADMDKDGIFCLMDMEKWLYSLAEASGLLGMESVDYVMENEESVPYAMAEDILLESICGVEEAVQDMERFLEEANELFSTRNTQYEAKTRKAAPVMLSLEDEETGETVKNTCPVDLVYILQTEGNDSTFVDQSWIIPWYELWILEKEYSNIRMCVLEERLDGTYTQAGKNQAYWYENSEVYAEYARYMPCKYTDETFYRSALDMVLSDEMDFRKDSVKLVMYIPAGITNIGFYQFEGYLAEMAERGICYSELHDNSNPYTVYTGELGSFVEKTGGKFFSMSDDWWEEEILELYRDRIENFSAGKPQTVFKGITATGYQTITLEQPLDSTSGHDSDNDGLTDWEEVNTDLLVWKADGSIELPTLKYCVENYSEDSYVIAGLERFKSDVTQHGVPSNIYDEYFDNIMVNTDILPIHSHPRRVDTDGDGILDGYNGVHESEYHFADPNPLKIDIREISLKNDFFSVDYEFQEGAMYNWAELKNGGSEASYGGNQSWFGIYGTLGDSKIFCNGTRTGYDIDNYGCGLIAAADTLFYMAASKQIEIHGFEDSSFFQYKNNDFDTYMSYVAYLSDYFKIYGWPIYGVPGIIFPSSLESGIAKILKDNELDFYWEPYGYKTNESEVLLDEIIRMIEEDYPVIFSYDCEDEGLPLLIYKNKEFIPSGENPVKSHYMVFTGGFIYSKDLSEIIGSRAMLQIATWGKKYYIDYTQYSQKLSTRTNILSIE